MSDLEKIVFDGLDLSDDVAWELMDFDLPPASKRLQRLSSPDADADVLAEAARNELRTGTAKVRFLNPGGDMDDALEAINELSGLLQRAEERDEGSPLVWTPATATKSGTLMVQSGEITGIPIVQDGEDAGWLMENPKPVLTVRFDCFPFILGEEYSAATAASSSARILTLTAADVPGTVPGLGRLVVTDTGSQNRGHVEVGGDRYGHAAAPSADFDILGSEMAALGGTLTGSGSGSYYGISVGTAPLAVCEAQDLPHIGPHAIRAQIERVTADTDIYVRAAVRTADGPWSYTPWKAVPAAAGIYDLRLGELTFGEVVKGTQASVLRFEAYASATSSVRIYRFNPIPTEVVYGCARQSVQSGTPTSYDLYDSFDQSAGNLDAPKTAPFGGNWASANRTGSNGFQVNATDHVAQRTSVSDASLDGGGAYALLGSAVAATVVQGKVRFSATPSGSWPTNAARFGLLARYVDTNNWAALVLRLSAIDARLRLIWKVSGSVNESSAVERSLTSAFFGVANFDHELRLEIDADGSYRAYWMGNLAFSGYAAVFAPGGALESGKRGLYDAYVHSAVNTRSYDDFQAPAAPPINYPLHSGRSLEVRHDAAVRENAGGTAWADVPRYRGARLYVPPAGPGDLSTRLLIKDRRSDVDAEVPDSADTARSAELFVTPRWLAVPGE